MTQPSEAELSRILLASPRWPHGAVRSVALVEIGHGYGMSGGTVCRATAEAAAGRVTFIVKREGAEATRRAMLFHEAIGDRVAGVVPALYGGLVADDHGLLILEDVRGRQGDVLTGCSDDELGALVRAVCTVHASSWEAEDDAFADHLPRWHGGGWEADRWLARLAGARERYPELLTPTLVERLADLPDRVDAASDGLRRGPAAWIHSDAHLDNVIWRDDGSPAILDWSGAAIGPPAVDLARLCLEGVIGARRIAERTRLVAATAAGELAGHGIAAAGEATVSRWIKLAALPLLQGIVGWAGRPEDDRDGERMIALRDNAVRNAVPWLTTFQARRRPRRATMRR